jgi:hypothetical protein
MKGNQFIQDFLVSRNLNFTLVASRRTIPASVAPSLRRRKLSQAIASSRKPE